MSFDFKVIAVNSDIKGKASVSFGGTSAASLLPKRQPSLSGQASPCFIVVDRFQNKTVDVDGDGISDFSHGEMVERLVQSRISGVPVIRKEVVNPQEGDASFLTQLKERFTEIKAFLDAGGQCQGVNLSLGHFAWFLTLSHGGEFVTSQNMHQQVGSLKKYLAEKYQDVHWKEAIQAIEAVAKFCPVYIAGGNDSEQSLNTLTLAEGARIIGALDTQGKNTYFTATHGLIKRFVTGVFPVRKVEGGFDITGSGRKEIADEEVSGGKSLIQQFIGKPVSEVLLSRADFKKSITMPLAKVEALKSKLMSFAQLADRRMIPATFADEKKYAFIHDDNIKFVFDVDEQNRITFEPNHSGQTDIVNTIAGTSYASPWAMTADRSLTGEI